jgi:hypothetical protein
VIRAAWVSERNEAFCGNQICVLWRQFGEMWVKKFCVGGRNRCLAAKAKPGFSVLAGKPELWRLSKRRC